MMHDHLPVSKLVPRLIGTHIRLTSTLKYLVEYARALNAPIFQTFATARQGTRHTFSPQDILYFKEHRLHFERLYLHASYWINPCAESAYKHPTLKHEITTALKLGFSHYVLHPGSAKEYQDIKRGIEALARTLNNLTKTVPDIFFVIENTAHAGYSVGSNVEDFAHLLSLIDHPERIRFCIDTAHAHAYGYDMVTVQGQEDFIALIEQCIGWHKVCLIHLNDAAELCGSAIDRHEIVGHGLIGLEALKRFALYPTIAHIPIITELPTVSLEEERAILHLIRAWHI